MTGSDNFLYIECGGCGKAGVGTVNVNSVSSNPSIITLRRSTDVCGNFKLHAVLLPFLSVLEPAQITILTL